MSFPASASFPTAARFPKTVYFGFEGDSLTSGFTGVTAYPTLLSSKTEYSGQRLSNVSLDGDTVQNMASGIAATITSIGKPTGNPGLFFVWAGTNDLGSRTSAQIFADIQTIWFAARTAGYKVIAFLIMPRLLIAASETKRQDVNASILANAASYDALIDTQTLFPDYSDPILFNGDNLHLSTAGNQVLVNHIDGRRFLTLL